MDREKRSGSVTPSPSESDPIPDGWNPSRLLGWHQDEEGQWVAELSCGHTQHLRHQPPWQNRAWVLDASQRQAQIGQTFLCGWCAQLSNREEA